MNQAQLAELGRYFDEYMYGDRKQPGVRQAVFLFKAIAKDLYGLESSQIREKYTLEKYIAQILIPDVVADLERRQATHPVILPEKILRK